MVAIVVGVGATRGWRSTWLGAGGGLGILVVVVAVFGLALSTLPIGPLSAGHRHSPARVRAAVAAQGHPAGRGARFRRPPDGRGCRAGSAGRARASTGRPSWSRSRACCSRASRSRSSWSSVWRGGGRAECCCDRGDFQLPRSHGGGRGWRSAAIVRRVPRSVLQLVVGIMLTTFGSFWALEGLGVGWPAGRPDHPGRSWSSTRRSR